MNLCTYMNRITKITALVSVIGVACVSQAAELTYPNRAVRLLVGYAPGGSADALARIIAAKLSDAMGQNWVVDNRSGANGNLATEIVARANPDGHTILLAVDSQLTVNPSLYKVSFSVENDLQPVTMLATAEHILVVNPNVPAKTLEEFIAFSKQKPGALNYASAGVGGSLHLGVELLKKRAGINIVHVAYKGGGPAVAALLAGESQVLLGTVASTIAFINAGRLRPLAITNATRSRLLPDLPTIGESGYPGFEVGSWYSLWVPGATPKGITERVRSETLKALQQPDVPTAMARQGLNPVTSTQAELAARIKKENVMWAGVIKDAGIRAE